MVNKSKEELYAEYRIDMFIKENCPLLYIELKRLEELEELEKLEK